MSKRSFRIALVVVVATVAILGGVGIYAVKKVQGYPDRSHPGNGLEVAVDVRRGMNFPQIAKLLQKSDVISSARWFRLYAMREGATTKIRSGTYLLRDDLTPRQVLKTLLAGVKDVTVAVTFQEGLNMLEVFELIEKAGIAEAAALEALGRDPRFIEQMGISGSTVDGYLFPDTYRFRKPTAPRKVLRTLIAQHRKVWDRVSRTHARQLQQLRTKLKWTNRDLLILASIVEKEAVVDSERPRIAQVFINRLTMSKFKSKRLETDPTIRYGCMVPIRKSAACQKWDKTDRLRRIQLRDRDNPYNTYQHAGLPPGPIGNPGERSMVAALNPDGSKYLFFVSRNNGTHVFSKTLKQHERWVDKFQR